MEWPLLHIRRNLAVFLARYADTLGALGIRRGDRVAVFAETCPELIAAFIGHLMSGVIHVPINTRYKADEARHILEDSGAVAVLVGRRGRRMHGGSERDS